MEEKEMEKDRSSRIIAIIALVIAVLGVSLGFATYAQNMTITQNATVKGVEGNFVVGFSTNDSDILPGSVTASGTGGATGARRCRGRRAGSCRDSRRARASGGGPGCPYCR